MSGLLTSLFAKALVDKNQLKVSTNYGVMGVYAENVIPSYLETDEMQLVTDKNKTHLINEGKNSRILNFSGNRIHEPVLSDADLLAMVVKKCECGNILKISCLLCACESELNVTPASNVIRSIRRKLMFMTSSEKNLYVRDRVKECTIGTTARGTLQMSWKIGRHCDKTLVIPVCKDTFCRVFGISTYSVKQILKEIKMQYEGISEATYSDKSPPISASVLEEAKKMARHNNVEFSNYELANLVCANSEQTCKARSWMDYWFKWNGDHNPTKHIISLPWQPKREIWDEYRREMEELFQDDNPLSLSSFYNVWDLAYPHVRIHQYKQVTGKCATCAILTMARKSFSDAANKHHICALHAYHRRMYMGEKMAYYHKITLACCEPHEYMSLISDGMQQGHCELPWMCNLKGFSQPLPQHLQGVLEHGREFVIYRTFHTLKNNSNVAIHCFLSQLERRIAHDGKLPDTIFYQVDGGSENANQYILTICELLVSLRLTKRIVYTRLPVGHTHEDIDSKFAKIWTGLRNDYVLTPQDYARELYRIFRRGKASLPFHLIDLFAVPDYKSMLKPVIDSNLGRYAKESNTQLSWSFQQVDPCSDFPLGVKTMYRAYCEDNVCEIINAPSTFFGFAACETRVFWQPQCVKDSQGVVIKCEGMYITQEFPFMRIVAEGFLADSHHTIVKTISEFKKVFVGAVYDASVDEWLEFFKLCPQNDSVADYLQTHELHVPLKHELFRNQTIDYAFVVAPLGKKSRTDKVELMKRYHTSASVLWSDRCGRVSKSVPARFEVDAAGLPVVSAHSIDQQAQVFLLSTADMSLDHSSKTVAQLKDILKAGGVKNYSNLKRVDLIDRVRLMMSSNASQPPPSAPAPVTGSAAPTSRGSAANNDGNGSVMISGSDGRSDNSGAPTTGRGVSAHNRGLMGSGRSIRNSATPAGQSGAVNNDDSAEEDELIMTTQTDSD